MLDINKGDKVILKGFTGIKLGVFEVKSSNKKTVTIEKKNGDELIFDRKTGKQVNVEEGKEKYANTIMEDDGSFVAPSTVGAKNKKAAAKAKSKAKPVEEDEDEEEEPVQKKQSSKKPSKKSKPEPEPEDDDEDEDDDDEFEEIDD